MALTDFESFDRLCAQSGIVDAYYDIRGVHHVAGVDARRSLLAALQIEADTDAEVSASLEAIRRRDWLTVVAPVLVCREGNDAHQLALNLDETQLDRPVQWEVTAENGTRYRGSWEFDADDAVERTEVDGVQRFRLQADLPAKTGPGYHRLSLQLQDEKIETQLIVAPPHCYLPQPMATGEKSWGVSLQLYSLRSQRNWGIGDFTDLRAAIEILAPLGVDSIGLNPLHALFPHLPENPSPYSPSSRDFINPLYLDIEAIDEFQRCDAARQLVESERFQARLQALRGSPVVDYSGVCSIKHQLFDLIYRQFQQDLETSSSALREDFREFQAAGGDALYRFALFEALQAFFHAEDSALQTWQQWPAAFRDPQSAAVESWAAEHRDAVDFHQYLQWQAELQLTALRRDCDRLGMQIGIYNDLAVGNECFSAQCWAESGLYALGTGVGAPPDDFSPSGQSWGLPPQIPERLRAEAYHSFIHSLRANMRHAGALRIDHVMGLMRLYWVPRTLPADQGTYVNYPFDDLLGILALESHRNRCLVIGEDLGTVPNEVRHALWVNKILSYRILMFEKDWQTGTFRAPADYPPLALCASGSHDLPTLRGYWQETDLELRESLKLYPSDELGPQQRELRRSDREQLLAALARENLADEEARQRQASATKLNTELLIAVQAFLASSRACLMMVQLEDMLGQEQQVNLPGTIDAYPNWRHKVPLAVEDWDRHADLRRIAGAVERERRAQLNEAL